MARLRHKTFHDFSVVIHGPPKTVSLTIGFHEHLVQMPAPSAGFHAFDPALADLGCNDLPEPMPPISDGFVANIYAAVRAEGLLRSEPKAEHGYTGSPPGG